MQKNLLSILFRIAAIIFVTEGMVMAALFEAGPILPDYQMAAIDALALILLSTPIIFIWVIKPFIRQREQAETSLIQSDRQRAVEREESEETLLNIIHESPVAIGITDENGRPVYWNPRFRKLGMRRDQEGEHNEFQLSFSHPEDRRNYHERLLSGERIRNEEVELLRGDGTTAWAEISIQEMAFEGQKSALTWVYDITARKRQEAALTEARQAAEEANNTKSAFLATMSHEIRTPLNGIISMTEMLEATEQTDEQTGMTSIVQESSATLLAIINDILDFSKIEAGMLELDSVSLSVSQIVEGVADMLGVRATEKGIELLTFVDPKAPDYFQGDAVRLRQILMNLVSNAVKFTEDGEVTIEVSVEETRATTATMLFCVKDSGIGLSGEQKFKLFQPFMQADISTARRYGGTGLGLSISKALVEAMDGQIGVDSELGKGSTFWFKAPLLLKPERRESRQGQLSGKGIVVVTANAKLSDILGNYMGYNDASVDFAKDGDSALDLIRRSKAANRPADMVLIDGDLPAKTVEDLVAAVAREEGPLDVKSVVMLTRSSMVSSKAEVLSQAFAVLPKPLKRNQLWGVSAAAMGFEKLDDALAPGRRDGDDAARMQYTPPAPQEALEKGALILVAEDNPINQNVIGMLLDRLGYAAEITSNGVEALRFLRNKPYGLLLTDCHMPEMDGYELTSRVRQDEEQNGGGKRLPIIALTADALIGTAERCLNAGMDVYLTKPVSRKDLDDTICDLLPIAAALRQPMSSRMLNPSGQPAPASQDPSDEPQQQPVLDLAYLREVVAGDEGMLLSMIGGFIEMTPPLLDEVISALDARDFENARESAHAVKGSSRMAGALRLASICEDIQTLIDNKDFDGAVANKERLYPEFERVKKAAAEQ